MQLDGKPRGVAGALLYELLTGLPPNYSSNKKQMFANIARKEAPHPQYLSTNAKSLLKGLLHKDSTKRLGYDNELAEIRAHPFFSSIDWDKLMLKQKSGPLKPHLSGLYFDKEFVKRLTDDQVKELYEENESSTKRRRQRIIKGAETDLKKMVRSARHSLQEKQKQAKSSGLPGSSGMSRQQAATQVQKRYRGFSIRKGKGGPPIDDDTNEDKAGTSKQ